MITNNEPTIFRLLNQSLELLPERAIYWHEENALILSDLHMGKASHFRKAGVPIPSQVHVKELFVLDEILHHFQPKKLLIIGDLFHSDLNREWEMFYSWCHSYPDLKKILVLGNHDILPKSLYKNSDLEIHDYLKIEPFVFTHERIELKDPDLLNISGHLHPGVSMIGAGKQSLKLPCFLFGQNYGYLPAFGHFTGLARIRPNKKENVFVIAENQVIHVT